MQTILRSNETNCVKPLNILEWHACYPINLINLTSHTAIPTPGAFHNARKYICTILNYTQLYTATQGCIPIYMVIHSYKGLHGDIHSYKELHRSPRAPLFLFLLHLDVVSDLFLNRRTATICEVCVYIYVSMRDQINEISFELRMETTLISMIFAVVLRYLSSSLKGTRTPTSAIPVLLSTIWAIRPTGSWSLRGSMTSITFDYGLIIGPRND